MFVTLAYIAFFLVCSWAIFRINQKSNSLSKSVFIAIFLGAIIGLSLHLITPDRSKMVIDWYNIIGNGKFTETGCGPSDIYLYSLCY